MLRLLFCSLQSAGRDGREQSRGLIASAEGGARSMLAD